MVFRSTAYQVPWQTNMQRLAISVGFIWNPKQNSLRLQLSDSLANLFGIGLALVIHLNNRLDPPSKGEREKLLIETCSSLFTFVLITMKGRSIIRKTFYGTCKDFGGKCVKENQLFFSQESIGYCMLWSWEAGKDENYLIVNLMLFFTITSLSFSNHLLKSILWKLGKLCVTELWEKSTFFPNFDCIHDW